MKRLLYHLILKSIIDMASGNNLLVDYMMN